MIIQKNGRIGTSSHNIGLGKKSCEYANLGNTFRLIKTSILFGNLL